MKCLVNIKQGYDRPISVTAAIVRPLAPFAGICSGNVHKWFILYFNSVIQ